MIVCQLPLRAPTRSNGARQVTSCQMFRAGHAYGIPGLPCHAGATSAKWFLQIDGRLSPAFGKRANECVTTTTNNGGNTRNGQNPLNEIETDCR